jgi:hypothetical protein
MRTRNIHTRMWEDEFFVKLDKTSKIVFIYLFTNQRIGLSGIYTITDRTICFDVGLGQNELDKVKLKLFPKVMFCSGWV